MSALGDYVRACTDRGECDCGRCFDRGLHPDPTGHVADLVFFKVGAVGDPHAEQFVKLTHEHHGEFCEVDPFDGAEHNFMELGGWIGDQGLAMQYMGLGALLGVFRLLTPYTLLGNDVKEALDPELITAMAASGFLAVTAATNRNAHLSSFKENPR